MKQLISILSFLTLTSCSPENVWQKEEIGAPPPIQQPDSETDNAMKITIGNTTFMATLATNATATAFKTMLPLTLTMSDFNSNEKVATLPNSLNTEATSPGTIHMGDIMLYGSSSLVLFYETFSTSYSYTRIGRIENTSELKTALGRGNVTVKFEMQ